MTAQRPRQCPGDCGSSDYLDSRGWTVGCVECARRNPDLVAKAMADDAQDLYELRQVLIAAEMWFLSIAETRTAEETGIAVALRARNANLGLRRGIRITDFPHHLRSRP